MEDVIYVRSSPAIPSPRVDFGVIEITDSEPEDLGDDILCWTERKQETTQVHDSPRRSKDCVKEASLMNTDLHPPQAGPSSRSPVPDPFPDAPAVLILPEVDQQETDPDPCSKYLSLVLEVIPDVLPEHALKLIQEHYPTDGDQVGERVFQCLFDDPSYPKVESVAAGKRKGKRKASEMEGNAQGCPSRTKIDFTAVNRPKPTGRNYKKLALVSRSSHEP